MSERLSLSPEESREARSYFGRVSIDLASTPDLLAALERRFDTLVFAGTILLVDGPAGKQEQRVVRRKGHDLVQAGLVQLLAMHCQLQELAVDRGDPIGGGT